MKKILFMCCLFLCTSLTPALCIGSNCTNAANEIEMGTVLKSGPVAETEYHMGLKIEKGNLSTFMQLYCSERDATRSEERIYAGGEYDHDLTDTWSAWVFEKAGYDYAQRIDLENYAGAGLKHTFADNKTVHMSLSGGYIHHYTDYDGPGCGVVHRASIRPKASMIKGPLDLRFVGYYQPSIDAWADDYIMKSTASIGYWLAEDWGVKLERQDEYRSVSMVDNHTARTALLVTKKW